MAANNKTLADDSKSARSPERIALRAAIDEMNVAKQNLADAISAERTAASHYYSADSALEALRSEDIGPASAESIVGSLVGGNFDVASIDKPGAVHRQKIADAEQVAASWKRAREIAAGLIPDRKKAIDDIKWRVIDRARAVVASEINVQRLIDDVHAAREALIVAHLKLKAALWSTPQNTDQWRLVSSMMDDNTWRFRGFSRDYKIDPASSAIWTWFTQLQQDADAPMLKL